MNLIDLTRPYDIDGDLIRYGPKIDGGYVLNKKYFEICDTLYTYGVGNDIAFEQDVLIKYPNLKIHLYDHTPLVTINIGDDMIFHKNGLSLEKNEDCDTFRNHVIINKDEDKKITLKIDIDGYEIEFFKNINIATLKNVIQLVIEFHIEKESDIYSMEKAIENINRLFYCFHIHQNDHRGLINLNGNKFPEVSEITFINKTYLSYTPKFANKKYPINAIDFSNGGSSEKWEIEYK